MNTKTRLERLEKASPKQVTEIVSLHTFLDAAGNTTEEYTSSPYSTEDLKAERVPDNVLIIHNIITAGVSNDL